MLWNQLNKFGGNFEIIFVKFLEDCRGILEKSWNIVEKKKKINGKTLREKL